LSDALLSAQLTPQCLTNSTIISSLEENGS
jgi:hypothetical protein